MIEDTAALAAAAELIASLACDPASASASSSLVSVGPGSSIKLPGRENPAKRTLEIELEKLVLRISQLESRASASANASVFPETPNEVNDTLFNDDVDPSVNGRPPVAPQPRLSQAQQGSLDSPIFVSRQLTKEALQGLRDHVDDQSKLLDSQRQELAGVNAQLLEQKQLQERALAMLEQERVATLERELWKHQKANEAFQKALREIGEIVTAVARGDLTMKVRMNSVEMDPEITTFKRTINAMMDQLQTFASEVSRVAREVGTEGLLGGQARIGGVDGVWKELTDNGMAHFYYSAPPIPVSPWSTKLWLVVTRIVVLQNADNLLYSQHNGPKPHGSRYAYNPFFSSPFQSSSRLISNIFCTSAGNCLRHNSRRSRRSDKED
jgi:osomolarity two-component system sensor histidine kinase NIK1